jgi:hypothetical protein
MNITKRQLKKLIKEELQVVLNEVYRPEGEGYEAARAAAEVGSMYDDPRREAALGAHVPGVDVDETLRDENYRLNLINAFLEGELDKMYGRTPSQEDMLLRQGGPDDWD